MIYYLVERLRADLKKLPSIKGGDYPNLWCEVLSQILNGNYDDYILYKYQMEALVIKRLEKEKEKDIISTWTDTRSGERYIASFEQDGLDEVVYPENEEMYADIAEEVIDQLRSEDIYELEEEEKKGWRAIKRKNFTFEKLN